VDRNTKKMPSITKRIPEDLPSLSYAYRLTRKASRLGFDWPDLTGALEKLDEELEELYEALSQSPHHFRGAAKTRSLRVATPPLTNRRRIAEELGDLLFVLVNVARLLQIDPEQALKKTIRKFCSRFLYIETSLGQAGKTIKESSLNEMDRLWEEAKKKETKKG